MEGHMMPQSTGKVMDDQTLGRTSPHPSFPGMSDRVPKLGSGKAKKILKHGEVKGHALTPKQKRFFGFVAGGGTPTMVGK